MAKKLLKLFSCLAVMLMVVSIIPSGALAAEEDVNLKFEKMNRSDSGMDINDKVNQEMPEFETEEEMFVYMQNDLFEFIDEQIAGLENKKENLDEIDNEKITAELINEQIEILDNAKEEAGNAESLEDLDEIRKSIMTSRMYENDFSESGTMDRSGSGIDIDNNMRTERPEIETDEGTFESIMNRVFGFFDKWI
ncbi:hypothetical protein [Methanococcoides sp. AM1]|uniref:hypothetical protein n=1 Tax=Methanococcoides sp. AM1 TaxID=1201011 RepID=UPI00108355E4|nr:hypothetical protein [Methanococcoides sp. AM1]